MKFNHRLKFSIHLEIAVSQTNGLTVLQSDNLKEPMVTFARNLDTKMGDNNIQFL